MEASALCLRVLRRASLAIEGGEEGELIVRKAVMMVVRS
jgi:hypothetical protein